MILKYLSSLDMYRGINSTDLIIGEEKADLGIPGELSLMPRACDVLEDKRKLRQNLKSVEWWALRGSNPRHLRCKRSALPTELSARE
jgi:hypothetical protein